jgi:exonuclease SbcD
MNFIYTSDLHARGKNSAHRIGDYYADWLLKFNEVVKLAKQKACGNLVIGGDLFDSAVVSNTLVDDITDIIEKNKIHVWVVPGNHDMVCSKWENSKASSLAHMINRSKNIHLLDVYEDEECIIIGIPYCFGIEENIKENGIIMAEDDRFKIAIPHAFITIKPFHPAVSHILAKDIETNADLVLCSHFHCDWGKALVNNTEFINVGVFGRLSITEHTHMPKVVLVNSSERTCEIIQLESAKPGEEVFNLDAVSNKKEFNQTIDNFIQSLESTNFQAMSIIGMIENIAKENNVNREIVELINDKIEELENE